MAEPVIARAAAPVAVGRSATIVVFSPSASSPVRLGSIGRTRSLTTGDGKGSAVGLKLTEDSVCVV